ncbi:taurine catabolism dioxygenase TauD [Pseudomonas japonica]|uniref:taurine catabolism dioxygenase TauD n=1 Tax=Pseudomonas japonica TaxID=256466 RepID=UPI0038268BDF
MLPLLTFTTDEKANLISLLDQCRLNPYSEYSAFSEQIRDLHAQVPLRFLQACDTIAEQRAINQQKIHVLRNCPLDLEIPDLDAEDPVADKYRKKTRFISEGFLELFAQLTGTPLLSYETRNHGDFFTDVIAIKRYSGQLTGFSDSELVFHNDRTAHRVRADYVTLLGMRCPDDDLIYTGYIDGANILANLSPEHQICLREPHFYTRFDVFSRDMNKKLSTSEKHPILSNQHSIRFLDTMTLVAEDAPVAARDAFIAFQNAMTRATCQRHRILTGDLLTFANQDGLHNREKIDVLNPQSAASRWLLKTYAFKDAITAHSFRQYWSGNRAGCVVD